MIFKDCNSSVSDWHRIKQYILSNENRLAYKLVADSTKIVKKNNEMLNVTICIFKYMQRSILHSQKQGSKTNW